MVHSLFRAEKEWTLVVSPTFEDKVHPLSRISGSAVDVMSCNERREVGRPYYRAEWSRLRKENEAQGHFVFWLLDDVATMHLSNFPLTPYPEFSCHIWLVFKPKLFAEHRSHGSPVENAISTLPLVQISTMQRIKINKLCQAIW